MTNPSNAWNLPGKNFIQIGKWAYQPDAESFEMYRRTRTSKECPAQLVVVLMSPGRVRWLGNGI